MLYSRYPELIKPESLKFYPLTDFCLNHELNQSLKAWILSLFQNWGNGMNPEEHCHV